ncbi:MAG: HIT domain-containing protein [Rickettsiales bacterium]|nr:HIT domain-containing protein [Rickettsiales bacterium]
MAYDSNNIFAKIISGEVPTRILYDDEVALAFNDISPAADIHVLVVPKGEYESFDDFARIAGADVVAKFFQAVQKVAEQLGVTKTGYRLITNHGQDAHQTVPHFHVHILGGKPLGPLVAGDALER